jgi:arylsulfatase
MTAPDGAVGRRMSEAVPRFVPYSKPPAGAPHVVAIVLDDVGFAQLGCFGSPIATPHIDRLAAGGLRYNRFHVTSICSSTRAALLSGRNHHAVGMGMTMETPMGFPGYTGRIPRSAALLPRLLRDAGYNTFAVGKWHLCPQGEYSASGPTTRWPLGMGFDRYYGFLGAETSQWSPELCRDNTFVDPPRTPAEGYHLSEDLVDQAIRMVLDQRQATPDKPFFCYLATGAAHAPHQVPPAWSDAYRGRFDDGWEAMRSATFERQLEEGIIPPGTVLTERPPWVQNWAELTAGERQLFARYMEVFAGFLTHADAQIGRFLTFLEERGDLENTLVLLLSDNGASAEGSQVGTINEPDAWVGQAEAPADAFGHIDAIGGHQAFNHYPWGWAWAGNTPLQVWKRYAWLGGVRTPLLVHWPGHVGGAGEVRSQFCHAVDLFATVLDAVGVARPEVVDGVTQQPVDGASIAASFADPAAPSPRRTQYFEMHGSRGIYHDGWKATTDYVSPLFGERSLLEGSQNFDDDHWALFNLDEDFAEARDRSADEPARTAALEQLWWAEAGRNQVLPLYEGPQSLAAMHPAEYPPPASAGYVAGGGPICESQLPRLIGGFTATAELELPTGGPAQGVVCVLGDSNGGWAFYLLDGRPVTCIVSFGRTTRLAAPRPLGTGVRRVAVKYRPGRGASNLAVLVDGEEVAAGDHPGVLVFPALSTAGAGMLVGRDRGLPFNDDYQPPFPLSTTLRRLVIESDVPGAVRPADDMMETAVRAD